MKDTVAGLLCIGMTIFAIGAIHLVLLGSFGTRDLELKTGYIADELGLLQETLRLFRISMHEDMLALINKTCKNDSLT